MKQEINNTSKYSKQVYIQQGENAFKQCMEKFNMNIQKIET